MIYNVLLFRRKKRTAKAVLYNNDCARASARIVKRTVSWKEWQNTLRTGSVQKQKTQSSPNDNNEDMQIGILELLEADMFFTIDLWDCWLGEKGNETDLKPSEIVQTYFLKII